MPSPLLPPLHLVPPLSVDLTPFVHRLDVVAYELATTGRLARWSYSQVVWTGEARRQLDAELDRLDAELAAIVGEVRERADDLRSEMQAGHDR